MSLKSKLIILVFLIALVGGSFSLGVWVGQEQCPVCPPQEVNLSLLWEAWDVLEKEYVNPDQLNTQEMIYGAISGAVKSVGDPYTTFLKPKDSKRFKENVSGKFEGVGMEIGIRDGQLQVIAPLEGTPAEKAGILAGDKILKVDGTSTRDITIEEAVNLIRGPKGTTVTLTIARESWEEPNPIEIERATIKIPSLKWELKQENIAYLKLYHFSEKASSDFREAALEILDSPAEKIILDLRNNPGGYLEVAQGIGGWFLERGKVVAIEDFGPNEKKIKFKAKGPGVFVEYPVVVLINEGSASGSEILAGALRDNRGVKLIGETSFGKGSVQEVEDLKGGSSLKVTVAKWLTPDGESITDKGLKPDLEIEMTTKDYQAGRDPQLDKAIELIRNLD